MIAFQAAKSRSGLTLLELVVVLGILVILASLVVPNVGGLIFQSRNAGNAALVQDVNHAVNSYVARFASHPDRWDSLLTPANTIFTKLHPQMLTTNVFRPVLQVTSLQPNQVTSLREAGITSLIDVDESSTNPPSDNASIARPISGTVSVVTLQKTPSAPNYGVTFLDQAFGINDIVDPNKPNRYANEFVVLGLGTQNAMRGTTMTDIPVVQSATPFNYYARILCVYMIPPGGGSSERARYIGCFLPDGSTIQGNIRDYNSTAAFDK